MNILFLCDEYPPGRHGGIGTSVQLLARALVRRGHRVVVAGFCDWGYGGQDAFEDQGVQVFRYRRQLASPLFARRDRLSVRAAYRLLKLSGLFQWDLSRSLKAYGDLLRDLIQRFDIDLVEMPDYNEYIQFCNSYIPFPRLPAPVVVKMHGTITYFHKEAGGEAPAHFTQMERDILRQADALCSVSAYTARRTAAYFQEERPVEVLYNGIDLAAKADVPKVKGQVIYSGSLLAKKGIYQLMKAWNQVHAVLPGARLLVYGKGPVEQVRPLLEPDAAATVSFAGHVDRALLRHQLAASEAAVFPSYAECFALGPMEAMAAGTAVVYTTRSSGPELISHGTDGLLAEPDDVAGLAASILSLLRDAALRHRLAEAGRQKVHEHFAIDRIAAVHEVFYHQVLTQTPATP